MDKTWILVADKAHARILAAATPMRAPTDVSRLMHPASQAKAEDLVTDQPGRDGHGNPGNAMDEADPREHEQSVFAKHIVESLEKGRQKGDFESLILVAPPQFLGELRSQLNSNLEKMVSQSLDKNLVEHDNETIGKQLFSKLS